MYEVCAECGAHIADAVIDPAGPVIVCTVCGFRQPFRRLPMFIVTGASGTGKSTLCGHIAQMEDRPDLVYLDSDMLLMKEFTSSGWKEYRNFWLWVSFNISQSGRSVVLFGSATPADFENAPRRKYFSTINYLVLACDRETLTERLTSRPDWRKSAHEAFLNDQLQWNQRFIDEEADADPPYTVLGTEGRSAAESARALFEWTQRG
jgi:shikimate kinase